MNPKTKIFYNGQQLRTPSGRYTSVTTQLRVIYRFLVRATLLAGLGFAIFMVGAYSYSTTTVTASTTTVVAPVQSPVLDRIADCESGNGTQGSSSQFGKSGQVLMKPNTNGTVDVGKYQINSVWFAEATTLHYDLTTEAGNKAMAEWIYANKGTGDWASSAHCWQH